MHVIREARVRVHSRFEAYLCLEAGSKESFLTKVVRNEKWRKKVLNSKKIPGAIFELVFLFTK